jgi:hypothetical protein
MSAEGRQSEPPNPPPRPRPPPAPPAGVPGRSDGGSVIEDATERDPETERVDGRIRERAAGGGREMGPSTPSKLVSPGAETIVSPPSSLVTSSARVSSSPSPPLPEASRQNGWQREPPHDIPRVTAPSHPPLDIARGIHAGRGREKIKENGRPQKNPKADQAVCY